MSNNNDKTFLSGECLSEQYVSQGSSNTISTSEIEVGKPLKRAMTKRHLVMISLGGAIGTGCAWGSWQYKCQFRVLLVNMRVLILALELAI